MMTQPAFSPDWLRDTIADLRVKDVRALGHGLWGPTIDLGDGTVLKLVRQRAGIGDGLEICGNEARVLAALGGGPLGHLAVPRLLAHATFAAGSRAAAEGYAAWMRLTRVAGAPFSEERLAELPARERDRFAGSFGESIAVLHQEAAAALANASIPLDDRVHALLKGLAAASPADGGLCAALTSTLAAAFPADRRRGFIHGDFHLSNLLVDEDGLISGVVDFAEAGRGLPEIDLAYLHWFPHIAAAARRSYEALAGPIDDVAYNLAGAIYALTSAVILEQNGEAGVAGGDRCLLGTCVEAIGLAR
jgi:aminoglycoside phosphotransferase (APT) family kinase protein